MFRRARIRLTAQYIALFGVVLGAFSVVFYLGMSTALAPEFDLSPDLTNEQAADVAYHAAVERIGIALVAADLVIVGLVGIAAWVLAARTLAPIREAHRRQRRFVADASHEMRTPLTILRSTGESALVATVDPVSLRASVATMVVAADRLTRLTNDLLLLARSDEGSLGPERALFDLSVLVVESVEGYARAHPGLPAPRMRLVPDIRAAADREEVGRIIVNLLDNAFLHGASDAINPPLISTRMTDREVELSVVDHGPGLAAADVDRIFEPFFRARGDAAGPPGSGLGLAIARSLAERNRGRLEVLSRPGEGASFKLVLPRFR